ncbi:MAG: hypothetical protein ACK5MD_03625 [Flavobacteriales bacterium]
MVYKQVILYLFIIALNFSCDKNKRLSNLECKNNLSLYERKRVKNDNYCFNTISDSLNKKGALNRNKYYEIKNNASLDNFYKNNYYDELIKNFYQYNSFVERYILENFNRKYLILIGQAKGATGIGIDYWNYECFLLTKKSDVIKFSSLSKTPLSLFF